MITRSGLGKIDLFHIVHIDKLGIISNSEESGYLVCDSEVQKKSFAGTTIGMNRIKERRMNELVLDSYPDLHVGDCVPFYFCPRSVMLYMFYRDNHCDISYHGGQEPIVHLVFNMIKVIEWAEQNGRRWVFTDSNAGSFYFNDYNNLDDLDRLDWDAINTNLWRDCKDRKQAEFLVEHSLPWHLVDGIAVYSRQYLNEVCQILSHCQHKPQVKVVREWYY